MKIYINALSEVWSEKFQNKCEGDMLLKLYPDYTLGYTQILR